MTTDPHIYKGEHNDLRISSTSDPEVIEVEMNNRSERRGFWTEVPVARVRSMLAASAPAGSYTRTDEDWKDRAEKAEQERDHLAKVLATTARQRDDADKRNARPLTPDAITDEVVERGRSFMWDEFEIDLEPAEVEEVLTAALAEPTRPEGAEELKHPVIVALAGMDSTRVHGLTQEDIEGLCDRLAREGVRVTEEQS